MNKIKQVLLDGKTFKEISSSELVDLLNDASFSQIIFDAIALEITNRLRGA